MESSDRLLIGTGNPGKFRELSALLAGVPFELMSLADVGIEQDVEETGSTFEENAALKATGDSLRLRIVATDLRLDIYTVDSVRFVAARVRFDSIASSLRNDLRRVRGRGRVLSTSLDSARLTVQIDTLAPVLRGMILLERQMAESFMQERDL